jgi:hypothetical protein
MSIENDKRTTTILRMISQGSLGSEKTGTFAKIDDIIEEFGDKQTVKSFVDYIVGMGYARIINSKFEKITGNKLDYKGYQITEHGRTFLNDKQASSQSVSYHQNTFGDVHGSNISIDGKYVSQLVNNEDSEMKELLEQLFEATEKKDKITIMKTMGYIGDKSLDLLVAIVAGGIKL